MVYKLLHPHLTPTLNLATLNLDLKPTYLYGKDREFKPLTPRLNKQTD